MFEIVIKESPIIKDGYCGQAIESLFVDSLSSTHSLDGW